MIATSCGNMSAVLLLMEKGADANIKNSEGQQALHYHKGNSEILRTLLNKTLDLNIQVKAKYKIG